MENIDEESVKTEEGYDQFLQDATLALREMWEDRKGQKIGELEAQALNDLLDNYFANFHQQ